MKRLSYNILIIFLIMARGFPAISMHYEGDTLKLVDFYRQVRMNHPIAQQAQLLEARGELSLQEARGSFDPKLISNFNSKNFNGKDYYDTWQSYVEVPTPFSVDLKAGYERNSGQFLNPERIVPENGLYYAGITVPLGQGLINNKRNIDLKRGGLLNADYDNKARKVLNNLLLDANYAYWRWFEFYNKILVVENNLDLIYERFSGIRESVTNGEMAPIDSLEAFLQVQQWTNNLNDAQLMHENSLLLLQNFLWIDSLQQDQRIPDNSIENSQLNLNELIEDLFTTHPELQELAIESSILELERKWKSELLKPVLDINYNLLLSDFSGSQEPGVFRNDYKLGIDFAFPLLLRKERANLKVVKLKQQGVSFKIQQKQRETINKVQIGYNSVFALTSMIDQQESILSNYHNLLNAEKIKFENGESSLFLLNNRENKTLEAEKKLIELRAKLGRYIGELKWASGILYKEGVDSP